MPKRIPEESPSGALTIEEDESELVCGACLLALFSQDTDFIGAPAGCPHLYHWDCLNNWAQMQNSCPQCKQRFRFAAKYDASSRDLVDCVKFRKRDRVVTDDGAEDDDVLVELCEKCNEPGNDSEMILCDGMDFTCNALFHYICVGFSKVPDGLWFCDSCIQKGYIPEEIKKKSKRAKTIPIRPPSPESLQTPAQIMVMPAARLFSSRLVVQSGATRRTLTSSSVPRQLKLNEWESLPASSSAYRTTSRFETIERIRQRRLEMKRKNLNP